MKTCNLSAFCLALTVFGAQAQTANSDPNQTDTGVPQPTAPQIGSNGANFNVWQWQTYELLGNGQIATHLHSYTELASGLNYQDPSSGQWRSSQELVEPYAQGAIAQHGQHQIIFANNLNSAGAIDQQTPDNKRLRSNILGLAYFDRSTGKGVVIAQIQDSQGELVSGNQVLYPNAFTGIKADVRYTYKKSSFEQDVILREQPPTPESVGLNSDTTEIEVLTEFVDSPFATVVNHTFGDTGLSDQDIIWGVARIGRGKAFDLGDPDPGAAHVCVRRQLVMEQGRTILIESVPLNKIETSLDGLPLQSNAGLKSPVYVQNTREFPKSPAARDIPGSMKLADTTPSNKGYVLDYVELMVDKTNFVFQGDTTYLVDAGLNLDGTTVFESGTVLKFPQNGNGALISLGQLSCLTEVYRPAIFTSADDNSVGESLPSSSGTPATASSGFYLVQFPATGQASTLRHMRFSYAATAVFQDYCNIWDAQFFKCENAINCLGDEASSINPHPQADIMLNNVLISQSTYPVYQEDFDPCTVEGNQISLDQCSYFLYSTSGTLRLTNSVLANFGYINPFGTTTGRNNGFYKGTEFGNSPYTNTSSPFQTVGAGSYYLANSCVFTNAGTTNIDPAVLADIGNKTTYPPIVYSSTTITTPTNLNPQARRDYIGNPDLGYHYDPLDYVFGNSIAKSNLTVSAGTAVGYYYASSGAAYGLAMGDSATASFNGAATSPCYLVKYSTVQEGNGNWTSSSYVGGITGQSYTHTIPSVTAQFTIFSTPAGETGFFRDNAANNLFSFAANNCEMYAGGGGYRTSINVTNCLWVNSGVGLWQNYGAANITLENCTFFRGFILSHSGANNPWPVNVLNCAFDSTTFDMSADGGPTNGYYTDYNSFLSLTNITPHLGGHELTNVANYHWQNGRFGNYYLPTNSPLTNAGSITANFVGLYHFTTQTNQVPETNSVVDIGYHYVATDVNGSPMDTNGDGIPDYLEDANGNGIFDTGDLGEWHISPYGLGMANAIQVFTPLK